VHGTTEVWHTTHLADRQNLTARKVRELLEQALGEGLDGYKTVIKTTLLGLMLGEAAEGEEEPSLNGEDGREDPSGEAAAAAAIEDDDEEEEEESSDSEEEVEKRPRKNASGAGKGWNKEMVLSEQLAAVLGRGAATRPQVVKTLWSYVKAHNLQDPANKTDWVLDAALKAVFPGRERVSCFAMNKVSVCPRKGPEGGGGG
jgi:upstream activation factor subunit UAF30